MSQDPTCKDTTDENYDDKTWPVDNRHRPTNVDMHSKLSTKFQCNKWTKLCPKHVILLAATPWGGANRLFNDQFVTAHFVAHRVSKFSTLNMHGNDGIIVETLLGILIKVMRCNMKCFGSNLAPQPVLLWGQMHGYFGHKKGDTIRVMGFTYCGTVETLVN